MACRDLGFRELSAFRGPSAYEWNTLRVFSCGVFKEAIFFDGFSPLITKRLSLHMWTPNQNTLFREVLIEDLHEVVRAFGYRRQRQHSSP